MSSHSTALEQPVHGARARGISVLIESHLNLLLKSPLDWLSRGSRPSVLQLDDRHAGTNGVTLTNQEGEGHSHPLLRHVLRPLRQTHTTPVIKDERRARVLIKVQTSVACGEERGGCRGKVPYSLDPVLVTAFSGYETALGTRTQCHLSAGATADAGLADGLV